MLIARLRDGAFLYEPIADAAFASSLLDLVEKRRQLNGQAGTLSGSTTRAFRELRGKEPLSPQILKGEQSNTAVVFGERLFLKLFRRLEPGLNTDLEITRFLNSEASFPATPALAGAIEYQSEAGGEPMTVGILQSFTPNSGDAWEYSLDAIGRFFEGVLSDTGAAARLSKATPSDPLLTLAAKPLPEIVRETLGAYLTDAETLGRRTAQMHLALASRNDLPAFAPEPITPHYQRSIYQHIRTQAVQALQLVRRKAKGHPDAEALLEQEPALQERIRRILDGRLTGLRIRTHGDFHLGQVLHTANDFVIIDFEGEPSRPLSERRIKRSALRDVAGMLRSFQYAPFAVILGQSHGSVIRSEDLESLEAAARFWHRWASAAFLRAYLDESKGAAHLPGSRDEIGVLLDAHLLEKALYEIHYELNNRPDWVRIPLRGVLDLLAR